MKTKILAGMMTAWAVVAGTMLAGCGAHASMGDSSDRELLRAQVNATLQECREKDPAIDGLMKSAYAYAVFPRVITAAVGVGGAYGKGEVYQNGKFIGIADMSQGTIGVQLGGQKFGELIVFQREGPFVDFSHGTYEMDARASAIGASSGVATTADYNKGVVVYTLPESGVMAQASLGVQKFRYTSSSE
jgi:lipid-binding SYLF domain-containing protein